MPAVTRDQIMSALAAVRDPNLDQDLVRAGAVRDVTIDGGVGITLELGYPAAGIHAQLIEAATRAVAALPGAGSVRVRIETRIVARAVQQGIKPLRNIRNTIAVASGKGGVGKSTTATNLALALHAEGAKVGVLDADIYGPSQPRMLGCHEKPDSPDGKTIDPNRSYGIQSMSIGYLVDEETPMIWRGPMVTSALEQLLNETKWRDVDYLVVDLPPGTGDIQLTLAQRVPVTGAIIVTTPQDIALIDARKGLKMFEKVGIPILGIVENMSLYICPKCGHEERIFGAGGGERMGKDYDVELLGALPLDTSIREQADSGKPTMVSDPDGRVAAIYKQIARRVAVKIAEKAQDHSAAFPKIVIQNT